MAVHGMHAGRVDVVGEVLAADVVRRTALVRVGERPPLRIAFAPEAEETVTHALRHRRGTHLRIQGWGEFSDTGSLRRVTTVEQLRLESVGVASSETTPRSIEDVLRAIASEVPQEDWDALPSDLIENLDHYIYGTPKR